MGAWAPGRGAYARPASQPPTGVAAFGGLTGPPGSGMEHSRRHADRASEGGQTPRLRR